MTEYTAETARAAVEAAALYTGSVDYRRWYVVPWGHADAKPAIEYLVQRGLVTLDTDHTGWLVQFVEVRS